MVNSGSCPLGREQGSQRAHLPESVCNLRNVLEDLAPRLTGLAVGPAMKGMELNAPLTRLGSGERLPGQREAWFVGGSMPQHHNTASPSLFSRA